MANIVLKTFAAGDEGQGTVTPQDDALIYQNAVSVNGIFGGATVTLTGANTLHVASGFGIICGRFFEINESDISVQLSSSGTLRGRLKIHLDLNNADNPIEIVTETGATLPALSGDSNININGGAFDMELCTFNVNELTISSVVNTFPIIDNTSKQVRRNTAYTVNDFVLCQSASDALIFICTTAGTTAIQEPTAYATAANNTVVTDGSAKFTAYILKNLIDDKAPKSHASTATTYGIGTTTKYGHCMTIDNLTQSSYADGKALSAHQGKVLNDKISKTEVLIRNSGDAFDPTRPYKIGELCIHDNVLYRCTTPCSAGTWATNQSCFVQDTLVNMGNTLKDELDSYEDLTNIRSSTSAFTVYRKRGYKHGRHYHLEVFGAIANTISSGAKDYTLFTFDGAPKPTSNKYVGTISIFSNGTVSASTPNYVLLDTSGFFHQDLVNSLASGDQLGFIVDFYI